MDGGILGKKNFGGQKEHEFNFGLNEFNMCLSYPGDSWFQSGTKQEMWAIDLLRVWLSWGDGLLGSERSGEIGKPGEHCILEVKKGVSVLLEEEKTFAFSYAQVITKSFRIWKQFEG